MKSQSVYPSPAQLRLAIGDEAFDAISAQTPSRRPWFNQAGNPPRATRRRREKMFGFGRCAPMDRNAKARIQHWARARMRPTEKHKHYGPVTAKTFNVLLTLLWRFHNADSGRCFPAYEAIGKAAGCHRDTVYEAIHALERLGILTWVHRLVRKARRANGLFGPVSATMTTVERTSNAYTFTDPLMSCKSEIPTRTAKQNSKRQEGGCPNDAGGTSENQIRPSGKPEAMNGGLHGQHSRASP